MDAVRAQQYLKAMGITAWAPRHGGDNAAITTASDLPPLPQVPSSEKTQPVASPVAHLTAPAQYLGQLGNALVTPVRANGGGLLLITEPPVLTPADTALLSKMLAAINLDLASQGLAGLSAEGAVSVRDLVQQLQPQMLLTMVLSGNNAAGIDAHRAQHHQPDWCSCAVAITHHPLDLNRQAELKRPAWEDLKRVKAVLDG